ncbi:MAG: PQQ-binding-like beta-propeller repeat protein [Planctomycetota bacterium]
MRSLVAVLAACMMSNGTLAAESWSSFQNGGRIDIGAQDVPLKWSPEKGIAWSVQLDGYGQSTPIVWGPQVYLTYTAGETKDEMFVVALDTATGKERWKRSVSNSSPEKNTSYVSRAAPTSVADEAGVFSFFEGGDLLALSHDGKELWKRSLVKDYGAIKARHGLSSSLEHDANSLYVWVEREKDPYVLCLDKQKGETRWKSNGIGATTWASPRLLRVGDAQHLVLSGIGKVVGLDAKTGKNVWELGEVASNSAPTPVPFAPGRFVMGATEGRGASAGGGKNSNGVVEVLRKDDGSYQASFVWRAKKARSSFGSPVVVGSSAYFVNRVGVVFCVDVASGEQRFAQRGNGSTWATPIATKDRVYLFGKDGTTTVIERGDDFKVLATNALWKKDPPKEKPEGEAGGGRRGPPGGFGGPVLYGAAVAGKRLILRRGDIVYCVAGE